VHAIKKMDYNTTIFHQNLKFLEGNADLTKRLKHYFQNAEYKNFFDRSR